jgi:hypothetical protein
MNIFHRLKSQRNPYHLIYRQIELVQKAIDCRKSLHVNEKSRPCKDRLLLNFNHSITASQSSLQRYKHQTERIDYKYLAQCLSRPTQLAQKQRLN